VALTTQRSTVVNVDAQGQPLRPAMVWLDQRRTEGLPPGRRAVGAGLPPGGHDRTVAYLQAEAEANWIRTHQPEVWARTHKYLFLSGYLTHRLTGRFVDSVAARWATCPSTTSAGWARPGLEVAGGALDPGGCPIWCRRPASWARNHRQAAEATGLPAGLPLVAAAADKACEVIGAGCLEPHIGCLSYGTTATINTTHRRYIEPIPLIPPYPAAVPGSYSLEPRSTAATGW
jgi:sugar (pentulose or hexulose) kinase